MLTAPYAPILLSVWLYCSAAFLNSVTEKSGKRVLVK